jgi:hypothetical protein
VDIFMNDPSPNNNDSSQNEKRLEDIILEIKNRYFHIENEEQARRRVSNIISDIFANKDVYNIFYYIAGSKGSCYTAGLIYNACQTNEGPDRLFDEACRLAKLWVFS